MVADVHRILTRGGVFLYPADEANRSSGGKLRLMYEATPMAFLVEAAGGAASTGTVDILTIEPQDHHQRVPVLLGSSAEVQRLSKTPSTPSNAGGVRLVMALVTLRQLLDHAAENDYACWFPRGTEPVLE
jgi:hypothetical protein